MKEQTLVKFLKHPTSFMIMCGIVGFYKSKRSNIKKRTARVAHRGPDATGYYSDSNIDLGHTRLSIQDTSSKANQPFVFKDYVLVYNGEIYNAPELKKQLQTQGHTFKTTSDTEVLIHAYEQWKEKCLEKFNGMFSFCIYHKKTKELFLARDRFGIKPLYYTTAPFAFASEIKALIDKPKMSQAGLQQYLLHRMTIGPQTLIEGVYKLKAGHYMFVKDEKITIKKWYQLKKKKNSDSYKTAVETVRKLLTIAVQRRMLADVPVSSYLSGGLDSSIVASIAKGHTDDLNTFSIGFEEIDETTYARIVAQQIQSHHFEYHATQKDLKSLISKMIYHMDEPICNPGFLPILYLAKQVSKHNKVVLSGDGADELFLGYDRYKLFHYGKYLRHFALIPIQNAMYDQIRQFRGKEDGDIFLQTSGLFSAQEVQKLGITPGKLSIENKKTMLQTASFYDLTLYMENDYLLKSDKMSSAFGLEQRVPFLDHELVEYVYSLPDSYKLLFWNEKRILKDTFKNTIPKQIISRPKHGFNVPIVQWFKAELGEELKEMLNDQQLVKPDYILTLLEQLQTENIFKSAYVIAQKLWGIYILLKWKKEYLQ